MNFEKELEKMMQMKRNHERFGLYCTDDKLPPIQTKSQLYKTLGIEGHFNEVMDLFDSTQEKVKELKQDPRFTEEYKKQGAESFYKQFEVFKDHKFKEIQKELLKYKAELEERFGTKEPDNVTLNNKLLEMQILSTIPNNDVLIEQFLKDNMESTTIRNLVSAKYGTDNPNIQNSIKAFEEEQAMPFTTVNKELEMISVFIQNQDFVCDRDYLVKEKLTEFRPVRGEVKHGETLAQELGEGRDIQDNEQKEQN